MIFVHIGAGAGDQDPGADGKNFRDGFSEFVKSHQADKKKYTLWKPIVCMKRD